MPGRVAAANRTARANSTPSNGYSFLPSSISGLQAWYDASVVTNFTVDGSNRVSQWNDSSGNANHLIQATGSAQPQWTASAKNSLGGCTFDTTARRLATSTSISLTTYTIFYVYKSTNTDNYIFVHNQDVAAGSGSIFYDPQAAAGTRWSCRRGGATSAKRAAAATTTTAYSIMCWAMGGSDATNLVYFNNIRLQDTVATSGSPNSAQSGPFYIGYTAGSNTLPHVVLECLIYNSVLSDANRYNVHQYLSQKWAI